jgi:hypothetical protein
MAHSRSEMAAPVVRGLRLASQPFAFHFVFVTRPTKRVSAPRWLGRYRRPRLVLAGLFKAALSLSTASASAFQPTPNTPSLRCARVQSGEMSASALRRPWPLDVHNAPSKRHAFG